MTGLLLAALCGWLAQRGGIWAAVAARILVLAVLLVGASLLG